MVARATGFRDDLKHRRSVRMFASDPVPQRLIELAIETAATAPSGAHKEPWTFVAISSSDIKRQIREAAEEEERVNYLENRMNDEWQEALAPLGTDHHKEFLEIAPWIVVLFEQRYEQQADGQRRKNYYVKESCGIAAGLFVAALHNMGLATSIGPHGRRAYGAAGCPITLPLGLMFLFRHDGWLGHSSLSAGRGLGRGHGPVSARRS